MKKLAILSMTLIIAAANMANAGAAEIKDKKNCFVTEIVGISNININDLKLPENIHGLCGDSKNCSDIIENIFGSIGNSGDIDINIGGNTGSDTEVDTENNQGGIQEDTSTDVNTNINEYERRVLELVNEERAKHGLNALQWRDDLANVARAHSKDMNDRGFFSHTNPDGKSPFDRMKEYGIKYNVAAENIAAGRLTPESVMEGWMNSEGHRKNILNANMKYLGVGYYQGTGSYSSYWTQCFAG